MEGSRLAVAAAFLLLVGCSASPAGPSPPPTPSAALTPTGVAAATPSAQPSGAPAASQAGTVEVTIGTPQGNETLFLPDEATVPAGAQVRLTFENRTNTPHNLTFGPPIDARTQPNVEPGDSETFEFTAPQPGSYEFICTLHPWMTGQLVVTP